MYKYSVGDIVEVTVTGFSNYGIFVKLDDYYKGLIHISEISDGFVQNIESFVNIGERIRARITSCSNDSFKVNLSIKNLDYRISKNNTHIIETGSGFKILEENLNKWIEERKI